MSDPLYRDSPRSKAIRQLADWIERGVLPAGQALPTERELAERLDLPRSTVARAIDAVIARGLVTSEGGHNRIVVGPRRAGVLAGTVVVVGHPLDDAREPDSPSFAELTTQGALAELRARSLDALALDARRTDPAQLLRLVDQGISGVLVPAGSGRPRIDPEAMRDCLQAVAARGVPAVIFGDESGDGVDRVVPDHEAGAAALTELLLARGRKRPLQIFGEGLEQAWVRCRRAGYERAMRRAGLEPLPPLLVPDLPAARDAEGDIERQARHLLGYLFEHLGPQAATPVDALLLLTDYEGAAMRRACALLGREPDLVGYDGAIGAWAAGHRWDPSPLLATIDKRLWQCGVELVRLMQWRLELGSAPVPRRVLVAPAVLTTTRV
jgi:DNA-binding LacI/PurR family transcriptional regulator